MRTRATLALAAMLFAGCSQKGEATGEQAATQPETAADDDHIACAVAGAEQLQPLCAVERVREGGELYLVVRHPDGGFRRFLVTSDGRGLITADGAQELALDYDAKGFADVRIGDDRYRFPASRKGS